jgi:hypothetical protein
MRELDFDDFGGMARILAAGEVFAGFGYGFGGIGVVPEFAAGVDKGGEEEGGESGESSE